MQKQTPLSCFNDSFKKLRELFYSKGRIGDSNVKLDELCKLLCIEIASSETSNIPNIDSILHTSKTNNNLIPALNSSLRLAKTSKYLQNYNGESLLGVNPQLEFTDEDAFLCKEMCESVSGILKHSKDKLSNNSFDIINEAFGHFIRDSFRQNIEDAQYMTPIEVVKFIVELSIDRIKCNFEKQRVGPIVCDPSCGVGSFLTQFYQEWVCKNNFPEPYLVGQDKVDRMARLTLINAYLTGTKNIAVTRGNSLDKQSPLEKFKKKCDLIITNPPFGAKVSQPENKKNQYSFFDDTQSSTLHDSAVLENSELLFLDLYVELLRPGGTLFAILPDSVFSSSGTQEILRKKLERNFNIASIIELPPVTFAQAGTRTKTCILELEKVCPNEKSIFIAKAENIGFDVSSKKGVPYRKEGKNNDLVEIQNYAKRERGVFSPETSPHVLSKIPSCVEVHKNHLSDHGWTPSHYAAERFLTLEKLTTPEFIKEFEIVELQDIVSVASKGRRGIRSDKNSKCISVLHIGDFGSLNMKEFLEYKPKTPGKPCITGDILFSKINPRIPRALVVPDLPYSLTCSSEFEVLQPKAKYCPYEIMLLLLSKYAQSQIQALTSGTSSSHNRIKTQQLMTIKIALPKVKSNQRHIYEKCIEDFKNANIQLNQANINVEKTWSQINSII